MVLMMMILKQNQTFSFTQITFVESLSRRPDVKFLPEVIGEGNVLRFWLSVIK